jgi:hypothetical protein
MLFGLTLGLLRFTLEKCVSVCVLLKRSLDHPSHFGGSLDPEEFISAGAAMLSPRINIILLVLAVLLAKCHPAVW